VPTLRGGTSSTVTLTLTAPANAQSLQLGFVPAAFIQIPDADSPTGRPDGLEDPVPENNRSEDLRITYK